MRAEADKGGPTCTPVWGFTPHWNATRPSTWRSFKGLGPRLSMMKFENLDVRFAILEVTESLLVVTAGFYGIKSGHGLSREVWATSWTHFPDMVARQIAPTDTGAK